MGLFSRVKKTTMSDMHHGKSASGKTVKDPICGMDVNVDSPIATSIYQGQTYYFCALGCKKEFDKNPAKYALGSESEDQMSGHEHGESCCM